MSRGRKSLSLSEEQLAEVEKLASLQFTVTEIATMLGVNVEAFEGLADAEGTPAHAAIETGRMKGAAVVRAALLKRAREGDLSAQKEYLRLVEEREAAERRRKRPKR